ncbi:uncharacterized protein C1orf198 homolog [Protopterus annectens]|uniref:uncharacterized protein C1orf198 homolog n=1 Tax=Protopterus annectens TaxID=7888 RepID=UPI001CF9F64F|nr:uncharacterized protein C1orf198 homolog [Protopterus annectens]
MAMAAMPSTTAGLHLEEKKFEYFSSLNSMSRKIMMERKKIMDEYGPRWEQLPAKEQDDIIDRQLVNPQVKARYAFHRAQQEEVVCYPTLQIQTGQKVVHFGEEDITWQDEHSAPFSWETKSQIEFSIATTFDQGGLIFQSETKQPGKTPQGGTQPQKASNLVQLPKTSLGNKVGSTDGLTPSRKEEESAFWKISAERSKHDSDHSEFAFVMPSQIKSLEKGEKQPSTYQRQDSTPKDLEENKAEYLTESKPEKIRTTSSIASALDWEASPPSKASVSSMEDVFVGEAVVSPPPVSEEESKEKSPVEALSSDSQLFSQISTSNFILKSGFDFLDNW